MSHQENLFQNLETLRDDIDEIDRSLIALLESRLEVCRTIAEVKQSVALSLRDEVREQEVVSALESQTQDLRLKSYLPRLYKTISAMCLEVQSDRLSEIGLDLPPETKKLRTHLESGPVESVEDSTKRQLDLPLGTSENIGSRPFNQSETKISRLSTRSLKSLSTGILKRNLGRVRWRRDELANAPRSAPLTRDQRTWLTSKGFAHRGLHNALDKLPENSLSAFEAAVEKGFGIELDVHLSRDGIPIVFHDEELTRMTGAEGELKEYSLAELKALKLIPNGEVIPTLKEALDLIAGRVPILVEVKNYGHPVGPLERAVGEVVSEYEGPLAIQSFNPMSLKWFYRHHPQLVRGLIAYSFPVEEVPMKATTRFLLKNLLFTPLCKPHYIAYEHQDLTRHRLRRLHRMRVRGTPVLVWTVRTQAHADLALKRSDNIIFEDFHPS